MSRRPPISTLTDTLFPSTPLFRSLAQGPLDHVHAMGDTVALRHAAAALAVHADRMHLVEIGEGAVTLGHVAQLGQGRDVAIHRIDRFEGDDLGPRRVCRSDEHTSELQSLMRISYAVFCLKKK